MAFSIKIQGSEFIEFSDFNLAIGYDSIASGFSFSAPFFADNPTHKNLFRPFSYRKCEIYADGILILTGVILSHNFSETGKPNTVKVGGYSVGGPLQESNIPPESYPLESVNKSINDIAKTLLRPFGLSLVSNESLAAQVLEKSKAGTSDTVAGYLAKICSQKNLILTHDAQGRVVITKINPNLKSIGTLENMAVTMSCNGAAMHHEITVQKQASVEDENATTQTISNPFISDFQTVITARNKFVPNFRPLVKEQTSGASGNATEAAQNLLANDLKAIKFSITWPSWYIKGELITAGTIVTIKEPNIYLFKDTNVFIESVTYTGTPDKQNAAFTCVLPEVYNGKTPKNIFL